LIDESEHVLPSPRDSTFERKIGPAEGRLRWITHDLMAQLFGTDRGQAT
jgi:hypothetical protein